MRKLIATFDYQGSSAEPVYRRVEVHRIGEGSLGGLETRRDVRIPEIYPYKTYRLRYIENLRIDQQLVAPRPKLSLSDKLPKLADEMEGA